MIERRKEGTALLKRPQPIETHGIQAFKDIMLLTMSWLVSVSIDKPLDFLETGNDTLLTRSTPTFLLWLRELA
jgi:hypothetical protein